MKISKVDIMRGFNQVAFNVRRKSPEILLIGGIVGGVAATVLACRATLKADSVTIELKDKVEKIHDCMANETLKERGEYSDTDGKNDLRIVYAKAALQYAKLYAPAAFVGTVSIAAILGSHNIISKRYVAISAAYATLDQSFKDYRGRVIERYGEEIENEIRYNIKSETVMETVTNEKGKTKEVKKEEKVAGENTSPYAGFYRTSQKNEEFVRTTLNMEESYANDCLRSTGHLFLNDVYKRLGIPETKAGQMVGWRYDLKNPTGDNKIDFNIIKTSTRNVKTGELEAAWLIDFNVDGNIWESM